MHRFMVVIRPMKPVLLFDWGDTLMRDFPGHTAPMADWPYVEALPGVYETLSKLHPNWRLCVASNADVSDEPEIHRALQRADLDKWFERVYCSRRMGFKKPDPQFFAYILKDISAEPSQVIMVGDSFHSDVLGANASGLRAVWFNWRTPEEQISALHVTIHQFNHLVKALDILENSRS